jgi:hypothetical protein
VTGRQRDERGTIGGGEGVRQHDQTAAGHACLCLDRRFNLVDAAVTPNAGAEVSMKLR